MSDGLPRYVPKAWGFEEILVAHPLYTLKRLTVLPGFRCSLHYHRLKVETFLVVSGTLRLEIQSVTPEGEPLEKLRPEVLRPGQQFTLETCIAHRFYAATHEPCVFLEVSTQDIAEDSYRLDTSGPLTERA